MEFTLAIDSILRSDDYSALEIGQIHTFEKKCNTLFVDNSPLWLTKNDWTALAEISIISQTRADNKLIGEFRIDYIYQGIEQSTVTAMFIRMYAGKNDNNIYLLSSKHEYQQAQHSGHLLRDSLQQEGFIHASPKSQLNRLANKYYTDTQAPLVMIVDKSLISPKVK